MAKQKNNLEAIRHSSAHILMQALERLYGAVPGVGPAIKDGFYHDFDAKHQVKEDDLPRIEAEMKKIIKQNLPIKKKEMSVSDAIKFLQRKGYKYGAELAKDLKADGEKKITVYEQGEFVNLCKGPHLKSTGELNPDAFKLAKVAGAYWKGDEKNKMLQRIYGAAFNTKKELDKHLEMLAEAEKRDHRKLGQELELFIMDEEVGAGLPLWLPKGALLKQVIENFVLFEYQKRGYQLVQSPHIASEKLFKQSGHLDFYHDDMYSPMEIDEEKYYVKPMNCPFHVKIYKNSPKSYRELPVRYTELGTVYRYERSGVLHGLTRVRGFTQDDAHIICRAEQLKDELSEVINLAKYILSIFGFKKFKVILSVRGRKDKDKYLGSDKDWKLAEDGLKSALKKAKWNFETEEGEAVFYGPKIDIKAYDAVGREWQISTIQLDFNLPKRFKMDYIDKDGKKQKPFMIHRALLGSLERFLGILIEHYAGAFPVWLSPVQVKIASVGEKHAKHCEKLASEFQEEGIRAELDISNETVGNKIRKAINEKIPHILVIGDKEMRSAKLHARDRENNKIREVEKKKFMDEILKIVDDKK